MIPEPTAEQIELACDVAIAVLYGDARKAAALIAEHDATRPATIHYSERVLMQALIESEQDLALLLHTGDPITLTEFLLETRLLNATKIRSDHADSKETPPRTNAVLECRTTPQAPAPAQALSA